MASFFNLMPDAAAPAGLAAALNDGATYTTSAGVILDLHLDDTDTAGYQMKIWGVNGAADEASAAWETYTASKFITLPAGDGLKTVYVKVCDDAGNETAAVSASITLGSAVPVAAVTGPDRRRFCKGLRQCRLQGVFMTGNSKQRKNTVCTCCGQRTRGLEGH